MVSSVFHFLCLLPFFLELFPAFPELLGEGFKETFNLDFLNNFISSLPIPYIMLWPYSLSFPHLFSDPLTPDFNKQHFVTCFFSSHQGQAFLPRFKYSWTSWLQLEPDIFFTDYKLRSLQRQAKEEIILS